MLDTMTQAFVLATLSDLTGRPVRRLSMDALLQGDLGLANKDLETLALVLGIVQFDDGDGIAEEQYARLRLATVQDLVRMATAAKRAAGRARP